MNGSMICMGECYGCKQVFAFNPAYVPSLTIDGEREPFCQSCIDRANAIRESMGLPPHVIHPQAYEPLPEEEMP